MSLLHEVAPPGRERQVKRLKRIPGIDNPWAVAWASYNKRKRKEDIDVDRMISDYVEAKKKPLFKKLFKHEDLDSNIGDEYVELVLEGINPLLEISSCLKSFLKNGFFFAST